MELFELIPHINTSEDAIQFLRDRGILRSVPPLCPTCQEQMTEVKSGRKRESGGAEMVWRCPKHKSQKLSIKHKSFLEKARIPPRKFVLFSYLWAVGAAHHIQAKMCGLSGPTVVDWNNFLRDVCSRCLLDNPITLGGPGKVVEIGASILFFLSYSPYLSSP